MKELGVQIILAKEKMRFVKKAKFAHDGHRPEPKGIDLRMMLSIQEGRMVQSDWTVVCQNRWFPLDSVEQKKRMVCHWLDGTMQLQYRGPELKWKELPEHLARERSVAKRVEVKKRPAWKPSADPTGEGG